MFSSYTAARNILINTRTQYRTIRILLLDIPDCTVPGLGHTGCRQTCSMTCGDRLSGGYTCARKCGSDVDVGLDPRRTTSSTEHCCLHYYLGKSNQSVVHDVDMGRCEELCTMSEKKVRYNGHLGVPVVQRAKWKTNQAVLTQRDTSRPARVRWWLSTNVHIHPNGYGVVIVCPLLDS